LDENQKLISILGVFFALTVFAYQVVPKPQNLFAASFFGVAMLLVLSALIQRGIRNIGDLRTQAFIDVMTLTALGIFVVIAVAFRELVTAVVFIFSLLFGVVGAAAIVQRLHKALFKRTRGAGARGAIIRLSAAAVCTIAALSLTLGFTIAATVGIAWLADWAGVQMSIPNLAELEEK
jgi:hypothetical protein